VINSLPNSRLLKKEKPKGPPLYINLATKEHLIRSGLMPDKDGKIQFSYLFNEPKQMKLFRPTIVKGKSDFTDFFDSQ
jgi:hypothetical protein